MAEDSGKAAGTQEMKYMYTSLPTLTIAISNYFKVSMVGDLHAIYTEQK